LTDVGYSKRAPAKGSTRAATRAAIFIGSVVVEC